MTLISYIVPCYNNENFIIDCLESILSQRGIDIEILVVDDGSTDHSAELVRNYIKDRPRLPITLHAHHNNQNKGVSASRKLGLSRSNGEYICFIDSDDYLIDENKSLLQLAAFRSDPSLVMVHSAVLIINHLSDQEVFSDTSKMSTYRHSYNFLRLKDCLRVNHIYLSTSMIKRSALDGIVFDSPQCFQYEDWALWLLLARSGNFKYISAETTAYRLHENSSTSYVRKNRIRQCFSLIECKMIVLSRCGISWLALKVAMSIRRDISCLIDCYAIDGVSEEKLPIQNRAPLLAAKYLIFPESIIIDLTKRYLSATRLPSTFKMRGKT